VEANGDRGLEDPERSMTFGRRIGEQLVVQDADILVGIPCLNDGPMVDRCLGSLEESGVQLLIVDNGSAPDVKQAISGRGILIRNEVNRYVNPAWNQMMKVFLEHPSRYDLLVIANSDLVLDPGWSSKLRAHRQVYRNEQLIFGMDAPRQRKSAGTFFAMTCLVAVASWPIPDDLLVMGGDDFIFNVNAGVGHDEHVVRPITMTHVERGTYDRTPEIWDIAREDTDRWNRHVFRDLVPRRIRDFLSCGTTQALFEHLRVLYKAHLNGCPACDHDEDCVACALGVAGGHACNCHQEGGGLGYRLRRLYKEAKRASHDGRRRHQRSRHKER
jgi:glycosyltransferase involved in cell wall biosynthesis